MTTYSIQGKDGRIYQIDGPEGATREEVIQAIEYKLANKPKQAGFWQSFGESASTLGDTIEAGIFGVKGDQESRQRLIDEQKSKYATTSVEDVLSGRGKPLDWLKQAAGSSAGYLAAPAAATLVGGPGAGIATLLTQYTTSNLARQAQENAPADIGRAALSAAGQTALDVVGFELFAPIFSKMPRLAAALEKGVVNPRSAKAGAALGAAFEIPQEIAQQALERWQAGKPLDDEEAKKEYVEAAVGALVLGGGMGAVSGSISGKEAKAKEKADEQAKIKAEQEENARIKAEQEAEQNKAIAERLAEHKRILEEGEMFSQVEGERAQEDQAWTEYEIDRTYKQREQEAQEKFIRETEERTRRIREAKFNEIVNEAYNVGAASPNKIKEAFGLSQGQAETFHKMMFDLGFVGRKNNNPAGAWVFTNVLPQAAQRAQENAAFEQREQENAAFEQIEKEEAEASAMWKKRTAEKIAELDAYHKKIFNKNNNAISAAQIAGILKIPPEKAGEIRDALIEHEYIFKGKNNRWQLRPPADVLAKRAEEAKRKQLLNEDYARIYPYKTTSAIQIAGILKISPEKAGVIREALIKDRYIFKKNNKWQFRPPAKKTKQTGETSVRQKAEESTRTKLGESVPAGVGASDEVRVPESSAAQSVPETVSETAPVESEPSGMGESVPATGVAATGEGNVDSTLDQSTDQESPGDAVVDNNRERSIEDGDLPDTVKQRFFELGDTQRAAPEIAMLKYQKTHNGVMSWMAEHIGDLTHRMTNKVKWGPEYGYGLEEVSEKVKKALLKLTDPYGFMHRHNENVASNVRNRKVGTIEYQAKHDKALKNYVNEHKKLPVYNRAQWLGREAAVAVGEMRIDDAIKYLQELDRMTASPEIWNKEATKYRLDESGEPLPYSAPDTDVKYSRTSGSKKRPGISIQNLAKEVSNAFGIHGPRLLNSGRIKLHETAKTLPPRADGTPHPDDTKGMVNTDGTVHLVANNIAPGTTKSVMLHEIGVHVGMEEMLGPQLYKQLLNEVEARTRKGEAPYVEADQNIPEDTPASQRAEERLAYLIENQPDLPLIKRILSQIKTWMYRKGWLGSLNADDLRTLAVASLKRVSSAETARLKNTDAVFYSRAKGKDKAKSTPKNKADLEAEAARNALGGESLEALDLSPPVNWEDKAKGLASRAPELFNAMLGFMTLHQIDQAFREAMPELTKLVDAISERGADMVASIQTVSGNQDKWNKILRKFDKKTQNEFFDVAISSSFHQIELIPGKDRMEINKNSSLYKRFIKLDPKLQQIYTEMRDAYDADARELLSITVKILESQKVDSPEEKKKVLSEIAKLRKEFESRRLKVYLPFRRSGGNYWLRYMDKAQRNDPANVKDGNIVLAFHSPHERDRYIEDLKKDGITDYQSYMNIEDAIQDSAPPTGFMSSVLSALKNEKISKEAKERLYEAYLDMFPATSLIQRSRKRDNRLGMQGNIVQVYANVGSQMAKSLATARGAEKIEIAFSEFKSAAKSRLRSGNLSTTEQIQQAGVVNTITNQINAIRNPKFSSSANFVRNASYNYFMLGNISSALVNLIDLPMTVIPILGGKYGTTQTFNSIINASKLAGKSAMASGRNVDWVKDLPPKYHALFNEANRLGATGYEIGLELFEGKTETPEGYMGTWARTKDGLNKIFQKSDAIQRRATLMATYDLALNKSGNKNTAIREAIETVNNVYGSALPDVGPLYMQGPIQKVLFLFKRFAINRVIMVSKLFKEAFRGESKEVRDIARRQLVGIYAAAGAFAGVSGMPLVGVGTFLAQMLCDAFEDDDDMPIDVAEALRDLVGDVNYGGPVGHALNLEIGSRTGYKDMFWRDDPRRLKDVGYLTYVLERGLGPAFGIASNIQRAGSYLVDGDVSRAIETALPSIIKNPLKAARYTFEGVKTKDGVPIKQDISAYNTAMQLIGFAPQDLSRIQEQNTAIKQMELKYRDKKDALYSQAFAAFTEGDLDDRREILDKIGRFNRNLPQEFVGISITPNSLEQSLRMRFKKQHEAVNGININKKMVAGLNKEYRENN